MQFSVATRYWLLWATLLAAHTILAVPARTTSSRSAANSVAQTQLCLVNKVRVASNLQPLGLSNALINAAQAHSNDQASSDVMSHSGTDGTDPGTRVSQYGYPWTSVAENVAEGAQTSSECMDDLTNSPPHLANILGESYTHFGAAMSYSDSGTAYWTQDFAGDGQQYNFPECPS